MNKLIHMAPLSKNNINHGPDRVQKYAPVQQERQSETQIMIRLCSIFDRSTIERKHTHSHHPHTPGGEFPYGFPVCQRVNTHNNMYEEAPFWSWRDLLFSPVEGRLGSELSPWRYYGVLPWCGTGREGGRGGLCYTACGTKLDTVLLLLSCNLRFFSSFVRSFVRSPVWMMGVGVRCDKENVI